MDTNHWRSKKMIESATETLQGSSRRIRGQACMVSPGNGIRPERARKSLNEKLETIALNSPKKDPRVNLYGGNGLADEIFLKDDEMGLDIGVGNGDSSPFCGVSDKLLQRIELLGRDHEAKRLDNCNLRSTETNKERQEESAHDDLIEMKRKIQTLTTENSQLKKSLVAKEELALSLQKCKFQVESEFETLMTRLDSIEKENAFLRYEYTVLEKDLEVKTEETEYARKSMELTHKQQLKNVNKIVELEAECQRLRLLFRKKFPERSISMRTEGEKWKMEMRRSANKNNLIMRDEVQSRKLKYDLLMEQIGNVRAENKNLMDIIMRKNMEIKDLSRGQKPLEVSSFDIRSENSVISPSCSKEVKLLMDDFNEMEKLAIVCTEQDQRHADEKEGSFDWIQVVLGAISKQERISKRGVKELLQDIKIALGCMDDENAETKKAEGDPLCITWKSPMDSSPMTKDEIKRHLGLTTADKVEKVESDEMQELRDKLEESEEKIRNLELEIKALRESKETVEAEIEMEKSMKEDLDTKLNIAKATLNETQKKLSSLEVELDYRKSCCEEFEGICIELQLQLESVETNKPMQRNKNRLDITAASVKLLECQETITNLRKQLRALATTEESSCTVKFLHRRTSLGNNREDTSTAEDSSCKAEDGNNRVTHSDDGNGYNALIVYEPATMKGEKMRRKKQGLGFLKKLFFRRKRVSSKKCLALTM